MDNELSVFFSYLDQEELISEKRAFYRKRFKSFFRDAKKDPSKKAILLQKIEQLKNTSSKENKYFNECREIFRMHYIEEKTIASIISSSENSGVLYESEVHNRINYITDLIIMDVLGVEGIFPGVIDYMDSFSTPILTPIEKS